MLYNFLLEKGIAIKGNVIDIGSGDGHIGKEFEDKGFNVTYIEKKDGIDAVTYNYSKGKYGLAIARNSLPFMGRMQFVVITKIHSSLKKGGYFYGTVFGKDEPWVKKGIVTPLNFRAVERYLKSLGFQALWQSEEKGLGKAKSGEIKNWHIFKFLCRK